MRTLPNIDPRIETGAVRFGNDWPGTFLRGDNSFHLVMCLKQILGIVPAEQIELMLAKEALKSYVNVFEECILRPDDAGGNSRVHPEDGPGEER